MKLAMQVIYDRLSEVYPDAVHHLPEPMTEVERPVAYEPGITPERGRLYLCQSLPSALCASGFAAICSESGCLTCTESVKYRPLSDFAVSV